VVGQPYRSFSTFLTEVDERGDYVRQMGMNVLKNHNFFSSLGIEKMKALLVADRPSSKVPMIQQYKIQIQSTILLMNINMT
jgi:hypothetical protein